MKDTNVLILGIEYKLKRLLDQAEKEKIQNQRLFDENQELKGIIEEQENKIKELKEEIQKVKLAKSLESESGPNDAKMKINELVREIDKCIGLLNQ